jgi:putative oxidoreductase
MKKFFSTLSLDTDLATLFLRLIFGGLFLNHGIDAIRHYNLYLSMSTDIIGIGAKLSFNLLIFAQFFCGLLIVLGILTRLAVIPIAFSMGVAFFIAHKHDEFFKKELPLLFLLLSIVIFILGSGRYSIDALFQKRRRTT